MKNLLFTRLSMCLFVFSALFFVACEKEETTPLAETPHRLEANLLMGNTFFSSTLESRNSKNIFDIQEVVREGEVLKVRVKGGGDASSFQFIWDGRIRESFPMGIQLILQYDNSNNDFEKDKELLVTVNVDKIIGERTIDNYHFHVINGSKIQTTTLNPDGTTTNKFK